MVNASMVGVAAQVAEGRSSNPSEDISSKFFSGMKIKDHRSDKSTSIYQNKGEREKFDMLFCEMGILVIICCGR